MQACLNEVYIDEAVALHLAIGEVQAQQLFDLLIRSLSVHNHLATCLVIRLNLQFKDWLLSFLWDFKSLIKGEQFRIGQLDSIHRVLSLFKSFFVCLALVKLGTLLVWLN